MDDEFAVPDDLSTLGVTSADERREEINLKAAMFGGAVLNLEGGPFDGYPVWELELSGPGLRMVQYEERSWPLHADTHVSTTSIYDYEYVDCPHGTEEKVGEHKHIGRVFFREGSLKKETAADLVHARIVALRKAESLYEDWLIALGAEEGVSEEQARKMGLE